MKPRAKDDDAVAQRRGRASETGGSTDERASRMRQLLGATLDGFILADAQGLIIDVNPAYCLMTGFAREELVGTTIFEREAALDTGQVRGEDRRHRGGTVRAVRDHGTGTGTAVPSTWTSASPSSSSPPVP